MPDMPQALAVAPWHGPTPTDSPDNRPRTPERTAAAKPLFRPIAATASMGDRPCNLRWPLRADIVKALDDCCPNCHIDLRPFDQLAPHVSDARMQVYGLSREALTRYHAPIREHLAPEPSLPRRRLLPPLRIHRAVSLKRPDKKRLESLVEEELCVYLTIGIMSTKLLGIIRGTIPNSHPPTIIFVHPDYFSVAKRQHVLARPHP